MVGKTSSLGSEAERVNPGHTEVTDRRRLVAPGDALCALTDVGRVRDHNEDTFYLSEDGRIFVVADGMGGHEAGEVASALAVQAVADFFTGERQQAMTSVAKPIAPLLLEAVKEAHCSVLEASQHRQGCRGMGTTLMLAYIQDDQLYTCHVGDVRCYLRTATGLEQLTRDHSVVETLVQAGMLTSAEARVHPRKNEILQALGMPHGITPSVNARMLAPGDCVLLCSDGLWEALADEEIEAIVDWQGTTRQRAIQLVDRANDAGGRDNITVVLYEHVAQGRGNDGLG